MNSAEKSNLCNVAHKIGVFECVVCGKKLTLKAGIDIIKDLKRKHRKRSVCSDVCMDLYDSAIQYVNDLHGLNNVKIAREIVIAKWFERGVCQHEKHSRIQARNAQGNAAA